jgi:CzcA family heavy metal efflux pump
MLRALVHFSLRFRLVVLVAAAALMAVGVWMAERSPLDVFPEFAPPIVEVQTEAPGMSSESVERLVTTPLESSLNGIPRLRTLRSRSVQGISSIQLIFEHQADLFQVRQMVSERVAASASRLPQNARAPQLLPPLSSTSRVLNIGLKPKAKEALAPDEPLLTLTDLSVQMRWLIEPALRSVPGVANVSTYGEREKEFQVLVRPEELRAHGVTLAQVKQAAGGGAVYGSAGFQDTPNQRLAVQFQTQIREPADLARTVVTQRNGQPVSLGQVATLTEGTPPLIGEGIVNDEAGLLCVVEKSPWANTLEVTSAVERKLETLRPALPGVEITTEIFRPATFIEQALGNLRVAMLIGSALVALILLAFLFEWRTAIISLTAIPLSLVSAVIALRLLGMWNLASGTLNTMILAGLAIAVGEVVDDAIIDVENVIRRLRLNRETGSPHSAFRVVLEASLEVRSAVVYASFIVMFVCLPIFLLGGVAGSFFRPLALAYVLAVLASLFTALTVTPALCLLLLPGSAERHRPAPLFRATRWVYSQILGPVVRFWPASLLLLAGLIALAVVLFPLLKREYLPQFQENDLVIHYQAKPGTGLDAMRKDVLAVSRELREETAVGQFGAQIGRAELGEDVVSPNYAELWISLRKERESYAKEYDRIGQILDRHKGYESDVLTHLQERIKEVLSGGKASIVVRFFGPDLATLRRKAAAARQAIAETSGAIDVKMEAQALVPQLEIVVDPYRSAAHGLTPAGVFDAVTTLLNGAKVGEVHQEQRVFDIVVWAHPDVRMSWTDLGLLEIDLPNGQGSVPLQAVADVRLVNAPNLVRHEQASRCIDVSCNTRGRDPGAVVEEIRHKLLPLQQEGYRIEYLGEYEARQENQRQLLGVTALSLVGIALLLYVDFRSLLLTLLVLFTLPFALIGGVVAAYLAGGVLSLGSMIGFITVLGIAARNGIMLVSHYRHLQLQEGMPLGRELVLRGAQERVAPILMTALAAGLGLLPLALSGTKPGYEIEYPMAVVILGGLVTSTLLNLLVLPVLYAGAGRWIGGTPEKE